MTQGATLVVSGSDSTSDAPLKVKGCLTGAGGQLVVEVDETDESETEYEVPVLTQSANCEKDTFDTIQVKFNSKNSCSKATDVRSTAQSSHLAVAFTVTDTCNQLASEAIHVHSFLVALFTFEAVFVCLLLK